MALRVHLRAYCGCATTNVNAAQFKSFASLAFAENLSLARPYLRYHVVVQPKAVQKDAADGAPIKEIRRCAHASPGSLNLSLNHERIQSHRHRDLGLTSSCQ